VEKEKAVGHFCITVPMGKITQEENSRIDAKKSDTTELMTSMRQSGLLQPIGVRLVGRDRYEVVFGNRRFEAAKKLGWTQIDAIVVGAEEDEQMLILNAVENMQRVDVSPSEQGRIFETLIRDHGLTVNEIAARIGVHRGQVELALNIYRHVPEEYRPLVVKSKGPLGKGKIAVSAARSIIRAADRHGMSPENKKAFFEYARHNTVTDASARVLTSLLSSGASFPSALKGVSNTRRVVLTFAVDAAKAARLEKSVGLPLHTILIDILARNKALGIIKSSRSTKVMFGKGRNPNKKNGE
jgi:ParB/RepB/Spo0J family partition protein